MKKLVVEIDLEYYDGNRHEVAMLLLSLAEGIHRSKYKDLRVPDAEGDVLAARISRSQSDELRSEDIIGCMQVTDGELTYTNTDFCTKPIARLESDL